MFGKPIWKQSFFFSLLFELHLVTLVSQKSHTSASLWHKLLYLLQILKITKRKFLSSKKHLSSNDMWINECILRQSVCISQWVCILNNGKMVYFDLIMYLSILLQVWDSSVLAQRLHPHALLIGRDLWFCRVWCGQTNCLSLESYHITSG